MVKLEDVSFELAPPNKIGLIEIYEHFLNLQPNKECDEWTDSDIKDLAKMPSEEWYSSIDILISKYGIEKYREHLIYTLESVIKLQNGYNKLIRLQNSDIKKGITKPYYEYLTPKGYIKETPPNHYYFFSSDKGRFLKGLIHSVHLIPDPIILKLIEKFALTMPFLAATQAPTGLFTYDVLEIFSKLEYPKSIPYIMNLKAKIKQTWAQKKFDKYLLQIAKKQKIQFDKIIEIGIANYNFNADNIYEKSFEPDYKVQLSFPVSTKKNIVWINTKTFKEQKAIPKEIKENHFESLKYLNNYIKDVEVQLKTQSQRIESYFLIDNSWDVRYWEEKYLNHPFIGILTKELIWVFSNEKFSVVGYIDNGKVKTNNENLIDLSLYKEVKLWHPSHDIKIDFDFKKEQPFKQIEREYYSFDFIDKIKGSKMTKSILSQLCKSRNWTSSQVHKMKIDEKGIVVQLIVEDTNDETYGMNGGSTNVNLLDIKFEINKKTTSPDKINKVIVSEILRDVDLFINVARSE